LESLFTRLYKYREREGKNDLENFSTELLSYCLENDMDFQKDFLEMIDCEDHSIIHISTQQSYSSLGRPDIEILTKNSIILIENKVDSAEGYEQLERYTKILLSNNIENKFLIYLTKFYEHKVLVKANIKYKNIKWWDVNSIMKHNNLITTIFSDYLIENELAMDKNFRNIDLVSLENIGNVISKMDEVIDSIKDYFGKKLGNFSKDSSRSTRLREQAYYNYKSVGDPFKFNINVGYFWHWPNEAIYFGVSIWIQFKSDEKKEIIDFFKENLAGWEVEPWGKTITFGNYKKLSEIVATSDEQLPVMRDFLIVSIDKLSELKSTNPNIFK
jgi:PD-(D/E)XK nuclease superfamily